MKYFVIEAYPETKDYYIRKYQTEETLIDYLVDYIINRGIDLEPKHDDECDVEEGYLCDCSYGTVKELGDVAMTIYGKGRGIIAIIEGTLLVENKNVQIFEENLTVI
jgi:hypothetical protein